MCMMRVEVILADREREYIYPSRIIVKIHESTNGEIRTYHQDPQTLVD